VTVVSEGLWGVLIGGAIATGSGMIIAWQSSKHQRRAAAEALRRDAYAQLLAWFSLARDEIRRTMEAAVEWVGQHSDGREQAKMDALTELYGSEAFRRVGKEWRPAFFALLDAYERWLKSKNGLPDGAPSKDRVLAELNEIVKARQVELVDVLTRIQAQARTDVGLD
jgi:gas vesicle protein